MKAITDNHLHVLFVCSGNHAEIPAFIREQKDQLERTGVKVDIFQIKGKGVSGYLNNYSALVKTINRESYNLVHAHFGFSGLLANLQRKLPVVTTFHGCDLNEKRKRRVSKVAAKLSRRVIVVSDKMADMLSGNIKKEVIPCGLDMNLFVPLDKDAARRQLEQQKKYQFAEHKKYILFSSTFDRDVKNPDLAKQAVALLGDGHELIELKNFTRQEVMLLMNAADAVLMTSRTEGSPQFIKEAMACNRPIVSTDVGDVEEIIRGVEGCFLTSPDAHEVAEQLKKALTYEQTNGRDAIGNRYNNEDLVNRIIDLYTNL